MVNVPAPDHDAGLFDAELDRAKDGIALAAGKEVEVLRRQRGRCWLGSERAFTRACRVDFR
jgi:hypothetical protein